MLQDNRQTRLFRVLLLSAFLLGVGLLWLTWKAAWPLARQAAPAGEAPPVKLPDFDYQRWRAFPVQTGRTQPMGTACADTSRQITGSAGFQGLDPVALVLAWRLTSGDAADHKAKSFTDWETYPFILCRYHPLRERIFAHQTAAGESLSEDLVQGKYVSPADLRASPAFDELLREVAQLRQNDPQKAHLAMSSVHRKAEEVSKRLMLYDALCGKTFTRLYKNALMDGGFLPLSGLGGGASNGSETFKTQPSPDKILAMRARLQTNSPDPFHLVGLDQSSTGRWFSLGELKAMVDQPQRWTAAVQRRMAERPWLYLDAQGRRALGELRKKVNSGQGDALLEELASHLSRRRENTLAAIRSAYLAGDQQQADQLVHEVVHDYPTQQERIREVVRLLAPQKPAKEQVGGAVLEVIEDCLTEQHQQSLRRLQDGLKLAGQSPNNTNDGSIDGSGDDAHRIWRLEYLETRFPDIYRRSLSAQPFPQDEAMQVLESFANIRQAYASNSAKQFAAASEEFFRVVRNTTNWTLIQGRMKKDPSPQAAQAFEEAQKALGDDQPGSFQTAAVAFFAADTGGSVLAYPGVRTLDWELTYNRWQPFMWSWMAMVMALTALLVSMALQARPSSKWWYRFGLAVYGVSLAIQTGGFVSRIVISERAPVGNMYETVIWASFMAAVLALVLECIYRRKVIALAGAGVAALGLILADHTPLALDPAISPLAPVLRTNYWLTVHVLTITSAYAAATLAWGLGNLSLVLLTFGKGGDRRRETLKTLSQFTYRAMQVTVLLLAAGTFLGGWWAAEAWGRFWGWDPKEVGALIALISYVVPLHARYLGWVREFGLALSAVLCYATVILSWYVVNFVFASGLHSYGFGDEQGMVWVLWAGLLNLEWVLIAAGLYLAKPRHSQFNGPQINGPASP